MKTSHFNSKRYSLGYERELNPMTQLRIEKMINLITQCDKLLDIGCWDGYIMRKIAKAKKAEVIFGVDNSKPAVQTCLKKGLKVKFATSVDEKLPFSKNEFDAVLAGEIIEHLYDVTTFLKEVYRVLKPQGQLILTTPNLASLGSRLTLLLGKIPWMIENELTKTSSGHIRYFTFATLEDLLARNGFSVIKKTVDVINLGEKFYLDIEPLNKLFLPFGRIIIIKAIKNS